MAFYLVTAIPKEKKLDELRDKLRERAFIDYEPFGRALTRALKNARIHDDGTAAWEEEDYCTPPLKQERAAVLDRYFTNLEVEKVDEGEGWRRIEDLPMLLGELG